MRPVRPSEMTCEHYSDHRQGKVHAVAPMPGRRLDDLEAMDEYRFTGAVTGVLAGGAGLAQAAADRPVARQHSTDSYLVANADVVHFCANVRVIGDEVVVRHRCHVEAIPGGATRCLDVAGKDAVPEPELVQVRAAGVIAPQDADVGNVEVIVGTAVHAAVAVMPAKRDHEPPQLVFELGVDPVLDALPASREGWPRRRLLLGLVRQSGVRRYSRGNVVALPERNRQQQAGRNQDESVNSVSLGSANP